MNQVQLVDNESDDTQVHTYNWQKKFSDMNFRSIASIKQFHHFTFSSSDTGVVKLQTDILAKEVTNFSYQ